MIKLTGLDDDFVYINPVHVVMVGIAFMQKPSTLAPGTMITAKAGTLVMVIGGQVAVKEDPETVAILCGGIANGTSQ